MCFFSTSALYSLGDIVDNFNDGLIRFFDNLGDKIDIIESKVLEVAKDIDTELNYHIKNKKNINKSHQIPIELTDICVIDDDKTSTKPTPFITINQTKIFEQQHVVEEQEQVEEELEEEQEQVEEEQRVVEEQQHVVEEERVVEEELEEQRVLEEQQRVVEEEQQRVVEEEQEQAPTDPFTIFNYYFIEEESWDIINDVI
jgi:hypothetical protein